MKRLPKAWKNTMGLYLDISKKNTGYAIMVGMDLVHYGEESFQDYKNDGEMLIAFRNWIEGLLEAGEFDLMGVEYAGHQKGRANELWHNMAAVVKMAAAERDIGIAKVHVSHIKHHMANHGHAPKKAVMKAVNRYYDLELTSDDISDAIAIGHACAGLQTDGMLKWL